ncbi:MAG: VWA domain-containing protein [Bacteroidales bacterium]|nr:VWA domain-containing protein [Bacteroidales bacterium]
MKKLYILIAYFILYLLLPLHTSSQPQKYKPPLTRILFLVDGSQSMLSQWESGRKIDIAKHLLIDMVDSLQYLENVELALRIYGHQKPVPPQDCKDTKLEVPFAKDNAPDIRQKLRTISPKGTTPIAYSLEQAGNDFPKCSDCRNIIILITDGIESCDGDPCAVSLELQKKGIVLKPFVIGIGLDEEFRKTFQCVGHYYDAANEDRFHAVMKVVISQALNSTTAQVNLLDSYGKPTETNVNMTFYDIISGKVKHNFVHTINHRGVPDTVILDPLSTYKLTVQTLPPVYADSIKLTPGKHIIIAVDAPQGDLIVKRPSSNQYRNLNYLIKKAGEHKIINVQQVDKKQKYIIGKYDIEVLTLPRIVIKDVGIKQSHTTKIEIPSPGIVTFYMAAPGFASLYVIEGNKLKWFYNLDENLMQHNLVIQPGNYRIIYRAKNAKETIYTVDKSFKVKSGSSERIKLF